MKKVIYLSILLAFMVSCTTKDKSSEALQFEQKEFVQSSDNCIADECTTIKLSLPVMTNEDHEIAAKINRQLIAEIDKIVAVDDATATSTSLEELTQHYIKNYKAFVFNKLAMVDSIGSTHSSFVMREIKNDHNIKISLL